MKQIFYILPLILLLANCSTIKKNEIPNKEKIIYIVPDTVQVWFNNVLSEKTHTSKEENVYFILDEIIENNKILYNLILCETKNINNRDNFFINNTNRYIYIKNNLYPLLLNLDQIFSTRDYNNKELLNLLNNGEKVKKFYTIYEKNYWVIFDNNLSIIIKTSDESKGGYRTNSPNRAN